MATCIGVVRLVTIACWIVGGLTGPMNAQTATTFEHLQGGNIERVKFVDSVNGFLSADGGRIHYTSDGGETWIEATTVNSNPDCWGNINGLYFRGSYGVLGSFKGWAVAEGGVVLKSTDAFGRVWEDANPSSRIYSNLALVPETFADCGTHPAILRDIFMQTNTIGVVVGDDGTYATTQDGGATWSQSHVLDGVFGCGGDPYDIYRIHFFSNSGSGFDPYDKGFLISEFGHVYKTEDGIDHTTGGEWTTELVTIGGGVGVCTSDHVYPPVLGGQGQGQNLELWDVSFDDPTDADTDITVVGGIGNSNGYIFRREGAWDADPCAAWDQERNYNFINSSHPSHGDVCGLSTVYSTTLLDLAASPPQGLIAGYAGHLFRRISSGGVANWDECSDDCSKTPCPPGVSCPCPGGIVWWQEDSVGQDSLGNPLTPPFGNNAALLTSARITDQTAVAAGHFGVITLYDYDPVTQLGDAVDVGASFAIRLTDGAFLSSSVGFVVGQQGWILQTTDGGLTWTLPTMDWDFPATAESPATDAEVDYLNAIAFTDDGQTGLAVGTGGHIARSTNGGATWTTIIVTDSMGEPISVPDLKDVKFIPGTTSACAAGAGGRVLLSDDNGLTWTDVRVRVAGAETFNAVAFATPLLGYAVTSSQAAYQTVDGGIVWNTVPVTGGSGETFTDVVTWGDGTEAVLVSEFGGVFEKTTTRFVKQNLGSFTTSTHLRDVEQFNDGEELRICGDNGLVLFRDSGVWSRPRSRTTQVLHKMSFLNPYEGFGIGTRSLILKYDDT